MKIIVLSVFFSMLHLNEINANDSIQDIEFKLIEIKKEKEFNFYIISMAKLNNYNLDSLVGVNLSRFNFHGTEFINLVCDELTVIPKTYLFEDNISGILPYYKFIIGFDKKLKCKNQIIQININNKQYILSTDQNNMNSHY